MRLRRNFNSQNGSPLGSVWTHSFPLSYTPKNVNVTPELHFRLAPFHAIALVASPRLKSWQETMEYLDGINLCYGKQKIQELQGHVSNAHTWTICKVVAKIMFHVVKQCIFNQTWEFYLLSNALNAIFSINLCRQNKIEQFKMTSISFVRGNFESKYGVLHMCIMVEV